MTFELRAVTVENSETEPFDDFWTLYPRHIAKKAARKAWDRIPDTLHIRIFTSVAIWRSVWLDKDPEFLPYPASWLNGERWEDELPLEFRRRVVAPVPARPSEQSERTEMPEHVRLLLAKLRGK